MSYNYRDNLYLLKYWLSSYFYWEGSLNKLNTALINDSMPLESFEKQAALYEKYMREALDESRKMYDLISHKDFEWSENDN